MSWWSGRMWSTSFSTKLRLTAALAEREFESGVSEPSPS